MWVLSNGGNIIVNSDKTQSFFVVGNELYADDTILDIFRTDDEAKKELKQIYDALIAGKESYSVG